MEKELSALIVDDEESARKLLCKLLEETLVFSEIRSAHSVASANDHLSDYTPDIIFLDIKMPGRDGLSFIDYIKENHIKSEVVFVTAYDQYAIKAVKSHAFDYLLKPVNRKELKQCIMNYIEKKNEPGLTVIESGTARGSEKITRIRVNTRTGTLFINPSIILYCKADGNYTHICTGDKQHLCSMNLGKVESLLPGNGFVRVGRSHIVNFEFVTLLDRKMSSVTLVRDGESVTLRLPKQHLKVLEMI